MQTLSHKIKMGMKVVKKQKKLLVLPKPILQMYVKTLDKNQKTETKANCKPILQLPKSILQRNMKTLYKNRNRDKIRFPTVYANLKLKEIKVIKMSNI